MSVFALPGEKKTNKILYIFVQGSIITCLLYTSDAADE